MSLEKQRLQNRLSRRQGILEQAEKDVRGEDKGLLVVSQGTMKQ